MECLDFSNNQMQSIPNIKDNGMILNKALSVGIIDIRRNNITFLTKEVLDSFSSNKFVMVDIRENPFRCDCGTIEVSGSHVMFPITRTKTKIMTREKDVDSVLQSSIPILETAETGKTFRSCLHHGDFEIVTAVIVITMNVDVFSITVTAVVVKTMNVDVFIITVTDVIVKTMNVDVFLLTTVK
ncbi:unnamed protein product [Mytilus coruscus]|uniref:LRRCT domain-containing protein n=1 Tax=Mytilus coruscus TaxID=42192 RepID=A0A6J8E4J8_MYTCO|nr:unnamed protein product [Mytilus coruscus]